MSAFTKLPVIAAIAGAGASLAAMASSSTLRALISRVLGISAPGGIWRLIAIILAITNLKSLPFVWHVSPRPPIPPKPSLAHPPQIRLFRGLLYQLYLQPTPLPQHALFQPLITSTRTPLAECDYNLHKSNSTYFSDLDISRTHLVTALLRRGIRQLSSTNPAERAPGTEAVPSGKFAIALGGITCHFRRELAPYARFEIWTRLLCWDRKWLYLVSHMVRPGTAKPASFTLQPWRDGKTAARDVREMAAEEAERLREKLKGAVFATSIAKYVVKKGRWTVPPETVLRNSGLLPAKPEEEESMANGDTAAPPSAAAAANGHATEPVDGSYVLPAVAGGAGEWTWETVEAERLRGLKLAELFAGLDGLHDEFNGGVDGVLGEYSDMMTPFW